jgi:hypothetical protein
MKREKMNDSDKHEHVWKLIAAQGFAENNTTRLCYKCDCGKYTTQDIKPPTTAGESFIKGLLGEEESDA